MAGELAPPPSPASPASNSAGGRWLYPLLLGAQTVGASIVVVKGIPLYRQLVAAPEGFEVRTLERLPWALTAVALIQTSYWLRSRLRPPLPKFVNALLGHFLLFAARLNFVLVTSIFSYVFIARHADALNIATIGIVITLAVFFSLFCYTLELERLGKSWLGQHP